MGRPFDRDLTDIFEVQDDVTHRIVDALKVTLSPAEKARLAESEPSNIDAYDYLLRGREIMLGKEKNRSTFEEAIRFFNKALALDPNYSQAHASLAFAHIFDYQNRWSDDPDNSLQLAKQYAQRAVEKDPNEPLAHCVTGLAASFEKDLDRAKSEIDIALSLNPNLALAHNMLGTSRIYSGQPLEAFQRLSTPCVLTRRSVRNLSTSSVWHTCLPASTKRRRPCCGSGFSSCPGRIFPVSYSLPLSAISAKSMGPAASGASSKRSTRSTRSTNTSPGSRCDRRTPNASLVGSRKPGC